MKSFLRFSIAYFLRFLFWFRYRITVKGLENLTPDKLNRSGGILFLPNHPTVFVDPSLVTLAVWPKFPVRPMIVEYMYYKPVVNRAAKLLDALPMPSFSSGSNSLKRKKGEKALQTITTDLRKGDHFLIYPGGRLKQTAIEEIGSNSAVHRIINEVPEANIVLVRIKGLWGSSFSRALTGKTPPMMQTVYHGLKVILKNLIFFTPKREVTIEFVPAPKDFPYDAPRLELNKYLENWYNQPDGLSDQKVGDSLALVSYSRWKEELPDLYTPEASKEEEINLDKIPDEIKSNVIAHIAKIADMEPGQVKPEMMLTNDVGLDSLDIAEVISYLHEQFDLANVPVHEITTVSKTIAIAAKQIVYTDVSEEDEQQDISKWHEPQSTHRRCQLAKGDTIPEVFLNNCARMGKEIACADDRSGILTYPQLKLRAIVLAEYIKTLPGDYIGILLPASVAAYVCVLACQLANKVPLMVNWTIGPRHLESVVELSKVQVVLSSWAFIDRLDNVDFNGIEDQLKMLEDLRGEIGLWHKIKAKFLSWRSPQSILKHFGIDKASKDDTAALLFTSGTESMPKGVPLSHNNIMSNQRDSLDRIEVTSDHCVYGFLPPFHGFGLSYGGLLSLLAGMRIAFSPDPTNGKQLANGFEKWGISIVCSAPTFVKNLLKSAKIEQLKTLRMCLTGAERTPPELFHQMDAVGKKGTISEGYGITECGPVLTINQPGKPNMGVGKPLPSVEICIVHQESHEPIPQGSQGMILARGPNVFSGYLNHGLTSPFTTINGKQWYITGDLGHLDEDGNLFISGRKKRFVKIGGEMISLAAIESALLHSALEKKWDIDPEGPSLAVCAKEEAGEKTKVFLFTKFSTSPDEVNQVLKESGFSNLVKISSVIKQDDIPIMGTGKINYRQLETSLT